ncbi:MAG: SprT family zinc-dependent metalloprotease [Candidatus Taylorbacteria bacterium]|nr:SprT family zinc-dependent metalloprotease [Candidatus Taylorbacteria bacterium]
MKKLITLEGLKVEYSLKVSPRARGIRLTIYPGGDFIVTIPHSMNEKLAEAFILKKSSWILKKLSHARSYSPKTLIKGSRHDYLENKERARLLIQGRVELLNRSYQFKVNSIFIRNQKTRWGSCSKMGNLNFNYRMIHLPAHIVDYIVVHELCHLKELNHSKRFWDLVAQTVPEFKKIRKELRGNSLR